jgi:hypothetical protein
MRKVLIWTVTIIFIALFLVYLFAPTRKNLNVDIWTRKGGFTVADAEDAKLYINTQLVGGPSKSFEFEELKRHFDPAIAPESWPPAKTSQPKYNPEITEKLSFEVRVRSGNMDKDEKVHIVYVRVIDRGKETVGAFRMKVVNAYGDTAYYAGCRRTEVTVEDKRISSTLQLQLHF